MKDFWDFIWQFQLNYITLLNNKKLCITYENLSDIDVAADNNKINQVIVNLTREK